MNSVSNEVNEPVILAEGHSVLRRVEATRRAVRPALHAFSDRLFWTQGSWFIVPTLNLTWWNDISTFLLLLF